MHGGPTGCYTEARHQMGVCVYVLTIGVRPRSSGRCQNVRCTCCHRYLLSITPLTIKVLLVRSTLVRVFTGGPCRPEMEDRTHVNDMAVTCVLSTLSTSNYPYPINSIHI